MCKEQKTDLSGTKGESRLEADDNLCAHQHRNVPDLTRKDGEESLLEKMLCPDNLNEAYTRVVANKGAAGIDGMTCNQLLAHLKVNGEEIVESIRRGKYKPRPVKRVYIPKKNGTKRALGIPTVTDRFVQQALTQVLTPIFEPTFSEYSFGFREGRSAHDALFKAARYIEEGYDVAIDIDIAKYFDSVNHDILMTKFYKQTQDKKACALVRAFLKAGVLENGVVTQTEEGTPQGGNLSPLLSNIYLTELDNELERRGHKFVRYADDCNIYVKSERAAQRVYASIKHFIEGKLRLQINEDKTKTGSPYDLAFLGCSFYKAKDKVHLRIAKESLRRFKSRVRAITKRNRGRSFSYVADELASYTKGWLAYFAPCKMKKTVHRLNGWIRRRLRCYIWKTWKVAKARIRNLIKLGASKQKAYEWGHSSKAYWRIAGSWILSTTITNERLANAGYDDILKRYELLHQRY